MRFDFAQERLIRRDEPLSRHSTFKIGGPARFFSQPSDCEELLTALDFSSKHDLPWVLIGNGSNVLFGDEPYQGLVISLSCFEAERIEAEECDVRVSCGMSLPRLAQILAEKELGGLEFAGSIPGTVGGALVMNAGYSRDPGRRNEMGGRVQSVKVLSQDGVIRELKRDEIEFGYRSSNLEGKILIEAHLRLDRRMKSLILEEMKLNDLARSKTQDLCHPSAGSVFKNPGHAPYTAGKMIDLAGLKGFGVGNARISVKHGNFIVNMGGARATDVLDLIAIARSKVKEMFGVVLELEIRHISSEAMTAAHG